MDNGPNISMTAVFTTSYFSVVPSYIGPIQAFGTPFCANKIYDGTPSSR